jgi:capsid protein
VSLWTKLWGGDRSFVDTVGGSIDRQNVQFLIPDSTLYIGRRTRKELNGKAEWLWQNFGIVKEGVAGIGRHVVGKGISLELNSDDPEFDRAAEDDFEDYFMTPSRCDLAGRRNGYEAQTTAVEQRLIRGEFFSALTENPEWDNEPCFQLYDSEEIGNPRLLPNANSGEIIVDGVGLNKNSRAINYYLRDDKGDFNPVDAKRMVHWYKPHAVNQTRGITDFAQAVNPLVDIHELRRLVTRTSKAQQFLALVLTDIKKRGKGAFGAVESAGRNSDGTPNADTAQLEKMVGAAGGGIYYAGEKGGAELVTSNSPSPLVEPFITDLLMRDVCAGWGVPSEFFWSMAKMNGGNTRFILQRSDLFFQIMGDRLIDRFCRPIAFRYVSHRIQARKLQEPKDPNWAQKMSWRTPPRVTVDIKENSMLIELLANGMITLREYCNARGMNYRNEMRQWIREPIEFIKMAAEEGAPPEMLKAWKNSPPMWRAPKPGTVQAPGADPAQVAQNVVDDNEAEKAAA